jgi:hypothetical protein
VIGGATDAGGWQVLELLFYLDQESRLMTIP